MIKARFAWPMMVLTLFVLSGCLFQPRDPEPPTGEPIPYLPRTDPKKVWENLQLSLNYNDSFGWEENLHPEFTYIPDSEAEAQFPGAFVGWDLAREMSFVTSFYSSGVSNLSKMRNDEFVIPDPVGDEVSWESVIYYIRVTNTSDGAETRYRASAIITFRFEGNFWYVYRWEDQIGESDPDNGNILPTMGVLRGTFGSK